jgi:hypothetical protein
MQSSAKLDKEGMAQPVTPVLKCEESKIKVDFKGFQKHTLCTPTSNHISMYITGIRNTISGQNLIHVPVQQGGKSSWNRPTDPNIKVDFAGFQTYKVCSSYSNHRNIYMNVI